LQDGFWENMLELVYCKIFTYSYAIESSVQMAFITGFGRHEHFPVGQCNIIHIIFLPQVIGLKITIRCKALLI